MDMINWNSVNGGAVILAAFASFGFGFLWFGVWFGQAWATAAGIDTKKAEKLDMKLPMMVEFLYGAVEAILIAVLASSFGFMSFICVMGLYSLCGLLGITAGHMWQMRPLKLSVIVGGQFLLRIVLVAMIVRHVSF